jgi:hypothetical protein
MRAVDCLVSRVCGGESPIDVWELDCRPGKGAEGNGGGIYCLECERA